jgi:hypothetical protein
MLKSKSAPLIVEQVAEAGLNFGHASEIVIKPALPPEQVQGNYQPASVTISGGSGHTVNVGQESPSMRQLTLPQKLASHSVGYWFVHLLVAMLGAAAYAAAYEAIVHLLKR